MLGVGRSDCEDLVQEIFVRAFSDRARLAFDGVRDYRPFLFTIARNVVTDWARKRRRDVSLDDFTTITTEPSIEEDDDEPWTNPEMTGVVEAYLRTLPEDLAAVHRERYVLGHTQRGAALALGLSRHQL